MAGLLHSVRAHLLSRPLTRPLSPLPPSVRLVSPYKSLHHCGRVFLHNHGPTVHHLSTPLLAAAAPPPGMVQAYLPDGIEGVPLWRLLHDDGDAEDVEIHEVPPLTPWLAL